MKPTKNLRVAPAISLAFAFAFATADAADTNGQTLLLRAALSPDGFKIQIEPTDRSQINQDLFVDLAGLRLWTDNADSAKRIGARIATPAAAAGLRQLVAEKITETGVEPDMIPVRGEEGKKAGTEGMVRIAGGEFTRPGEFWDSSGGGLAEDQQPARGDRYVVRVSSFDIDQYKVTNEDYCRFLNDGNAGYQTPWNPRIARAAEGKNAGKFVPADNSLARHPVVLVNWYQAKGYAAWAGKRLPTEAEWEFAATGAQGRKYPWGNEPPNETRADFPIQHHGPVPVDWYPESATPEGVFQMAGNSAEWCADYFDHASYAKAPPEGVAINPTGAKQAYQPDTWYKYRVMFKGWCKSNRADYFTSTKRHSRPPLADASAGVSFRCVKSVGKIPPLALAPFTTGQAAEFRTQWAKHAGVEPEMTNSIGMKLALLPPGEFTMGRTEEQFDEILALIEKEPEMRKNRGGMITWSMLMMPAHPVRITKPFYLGAHEVTVAQFREFAEASGYQTEAEQGLNHGEPYKGGRAISTWRKPMAWRKNYVQKDDEPVLHLGWVDCVAFCEWLSKMEGREYALPTEAEWEYGCRAGTTTSWHFGGPEDFEKVAHEYAWWSEGAQEKHETPRSVGQGKPNAFGLYDMHGNVWEYTADWWHRLSYKDAPLNDPLGPATQSEKGDQRRIIRGSSFDWGRWGGDSAYRMRITQRSNQHPHMGFRVAMRIDGVEGAPLAVDPDAERRQQLLDPGVDSKAVQAALKTGDSGADHAKELTIDLGNDVKMEFALIPAGSFLMGSNKGSKDEQPIHRVVISKPFYLARHELTQSQWQAVMGEDKRLTENVSEDNDMTGPMKAMNGLSWEMCQDYIGKIRQKAPGHAFTLPTEAQWEYACRAGSETEYHFGDDPAQLGEYAWFQGNAIWPGMPAFEGRTQYHDTGAKKPNSWGLHDMHGGVWEWCQDRYDADYYFDAPLADPTGPDSGRFRVLRGGSWFRYANYARSGYRRFFHPEADGDGVTAWILDFGARLAINLDEANPARIRGLAENLVKHENNPVLDIGERGAWDAGRTGCFSITQIDGRLHLYYMGSGGDQPWRIGLATSDDGVTWERSAANPVLPEGEAGSWDDRQVSMPAVFNDDGKLRMWYGGSSRGWRMGLATSPDGINWTKSAANPILDVGDDDAWDSGSILSHDVLFRDGAFHVWYAASTLADAKKPEHEQAIRIGYAISKPDCGCH